MPFYEYQCLKCDHRLEVLQKISDDPLVYCPECSEASLKKLISAAAFRLKGTGWYETDFKNNDKKQDKSASKSTDTANSESKGSTSDSTTAGKSESSNSNSKPKASASSSATT